MCWVKLLTKTDRPTVSNVPLNEKKIPMENTNAHGFDRNSFWEFATGIEVAPGVSGKKHL